MNEIFTRVSIRKFESRPVEDAKLEKILRAAMAAPSAGNQQPWEFYVITNQAKIQELAKCSPYSLCAANAPAVIVPCINKAKLKFPELDEIDLAIATQNILLEITALELGGVWLAVAPFEDRINKVIKALDIKDNLRPFALVALGYPAESHKQQDRFDEAKVHYVK